MKPYALAFAAAGVLAVGYAYAAGDTDILKCRGIEDSATRLTCYDSILVEAPRVPGSAKADAPVSFVSAELRHQDEDFDRSVFNPRVELHPVFRNDSDKTVVGISHRMIVRNAFGDVLVQGEDNLDIRLAPGATAKSETFYFWEDNPFIHDQPYDRLSGPVGSGTAKAEITVLKVVYSDGTIESY